MCVYAAHPPNDVCEQAMVAAVAEEINALLQGGLKVFLGAIEERTNRQPMSLQNHTVTPVQIKVDSLEKWAPGAGCDARYRALLGTAISVFTSNEGPPAIWAAPGPWGRQPGVVPLCLRSPACPDVEAVEVRCPRVDTVITGTNTEDRPSPSEPEPAGSTNAPSDGPQQEPARSEGPFPDITTIIAIVIAILTAIVLLLYFRDNEQRMNGMFDDISELQNNAIHRDMIAKYGESLQEVYQKVRSLSARVDQIETDVIGLSKRLARDRVIGGNSPSRLRGDGTRDAPTSSASPPARDPSYDPGDTYPDLRRLKGEMIAVFQRHMARRGGAPEPIMSFEKVDAWLLEDGRVLEHADNGAPIWIAQIGQHGDSALAMPDPTWTRTKQQMLRSSPVNAIGTLLGGAFDTTQRTDGAEALELLRPARLRRHAGGTWTVAERGELAYLPA